MATPVVMPQMGESIAEGTIVRWIKKVGDSVDRDEPLFEISTDKVDAEIPSPAAGTLLEIAVKEGETVAVNSVVATIGAAGESVPPRPLPRKPRLRQRPPHRLGQDAAAFGAGRRHAGGCCRSAPPRHLPHLPHLPHRHAAPSEPSAPGAPVAPDSSASTLLPPRPPHREGTRRRHRGDQRLGHRRPRHQAGHPRLSRVSAGCASRHRTRRIRLRSPVSQASYGETSPKRPSGREGGHSAPIAPEVVPMSVMRKKIAEHMVLSKRTSAHVYSVFEVNYSKVDEIRKARRAEYEQRGVKLTFTSFIAKVAIDALRRHKSSTRRSTATTSSTSARSTSASPWRSRTA